MSNCVRSGVAACRRVGACVRRGVPILWMWAACVAPALAQQTQQTPLPPRRLEPVVVTATRLETPADAVASSVTVLRGEDLRRKQYRLVVDALREVPGLDVKRNGGPGSNTSIFIRGADSDHTLVLVDGIEINDPSAPSRVPFLSHLTTDEVERIEILRGPQSGVWGSDAIGGVVHVITRHGEGPLRATAWGEGGSYSTGRGGLRLSGSNGSIRYLASASYADTESFSAREGGDEHDPYRNATGIVRLDWAPTSDLDLGLLVRHTDARIDFDGFSVERGQHTDVEQTLARADSRLRLLGGRWEQDLSLRYARHERDTTGSSPSLVDGELLALGWRHDLRLIEGHTFTFGVEHEWEWADLPGLDGRARTLAFYAQDQIQWGNAFGSLGLRLDDHSEFGSRLTGRAAAGLRIPETGTLLRSSIGTGFKAPSLSQLDPGSFGGNPELDPEESWGLDAGLEQSLWEERLRLGATFFLNRFEDLILAVFDAGAGAFVNTNVDRASAYGVEAFGVLEPLPWLTLRGSYTWTESEARGNPAGFGLVEGERLLRRPTHKAEAEVRSRWLSGRLDTSLRLSWVGSRSDLDPVSFARVRADDYFVVDASGTWQATERLRFFARIENALDRDYEDVLGFATPSLSAYGGVEIQF